MKNLLNFILGNFQLVFFFDEIFSTLELFLRDFIFEFENKKEMIYLINDFVKYLSKKSEEKYLDEEIHYS